MLETLATGRPALACDNPGMRDYVRPDGGLVLTRPGDDAAMAQACLGLLRDPAEQDERGRAGRVAVEEELNTERHAERLAGVLSAALD